MRTNDRRAARAPVYRKRGNLIMAFGDATLQNPPATPETDEEKLDRIAGEILDAHLEDEDQYLRERREEERRSA